MRRMLLFQLVLVSLLSCNEAEKWKTESSFFQKRELQFSPEINSAIKERAKDSKALSIAFNSTFDSTRFIISNVNSFDFLRAYPATYYFKKNGVVIFVYSGLEAYYEGRENVVVPKEILEWLPDLDSQTKIREPFIVEYSFFRLDKTSSAMKTDTLEFNRFLPLEVIEER